MPNRLLSSKAQSALLGALQPSWETVPWEETTGWSGGGMFYPRTGSMSIKPKIDFNTPVSMLQKIIKDRPGLIFDERTVTQSPLLTKALTDLSKDNYQVTQNYMKNHPAAKMPKIDISAIDSSLKRRYVPMSNMASSDLHPSNIAQIYGKSSVYGNHPVLSRLATKTPQILEKKLRWMIPSAMLAGKFLSDKIPGSADDAVLNAITKYGPETYLAASLAGNALPALAGYRAMKMMPKGRINRMGMKNQLMLNAAKVAGGYGLMAAGRKIFGNKDKAKEIKKEAAIISPDLKEYFAKKTYQLGPTLLAGGAIGYILNRLKKVTNESSDEALTAAPLLGAIRHGQI